MDGKNLHAFTGLAMQLHPRMLLSPRLHGFVCQYLQECVCVCLWFYQLLQMAYPLIHRSSEMKNPLKSEGREERNGQTDMGRGRK